MANRRLYICFGYNDNCQVSHLILETFVGSCPPGLECCHNNGDCQDNRPENLRWDTHESNIHDWHKHGGNTATRGAKNVNAKLTDASVAEMMRLVAQGVPKPEIAQRLGIGFQRVYAILAGRGWNHITGLPRHPNWRASKTPARRKP